jgi:hypothetical protein
MRPLVIDFVDEEIELAPADLQQSLIDYLGLRWLHLPVKLEVTLCAVSEGGPPGLTLP